MLLALLSGFGLSLALIVAIGAQNAFVLRQGLRREHVAAVVAFCALSDSILMTAGVAGLGGLIGRVPRLTLVLTWGGAAFLTVYGLAALWRALRPGRLRAETHATAPTLRATLLRAAGFTFLNPHVYLDTVLLVGSVGAAQPPGAAPAFLVGAGLASAGWFAALGFGARLLAPVLERPGAWRALDAGIGVVMLGLAAGLIAQADSAGLA